MPVIKVQQTIEVDVYQCDNPICKNICGAGDPHLAVGCNWIRMPDPQKPRDPVRPHEGWIQFCSYYCLSLWADMMATVERINAIPVDK